MKNISNNLSINRLNITHTCLTIFKSTQGNEYYYLIRVRQSFMADKDVDYIRRRIVSVYNKGKNNNVVILRGESQKINTWQ